MERLVRGPPSPPTRSGSPPVCSGLSVAEGARAALEYSLSHFLWKQAVFFAERLAAECPGEEAAYLLAVACFHCQDLSRARWLLQGNLLPKARYLLARCCFQLRNWEEAEDALVSESHAWTGSLAEVANGAAGLYLLGQVKERLAKHDQAVECYAKCLELCPFMWEAYERWSWLALKAAPAHSRPSAAGVASNVFSDERFAQALASLPTPRPQWPPQQHPLCPPPSRPVCQPAPQLPAFGAAPRSSREALHRTPPAHREPPAPADLGPARRQLLAAEAGGEAAGRRAQQRGEPLHRTPPAHREPLGPGGSSPRRQLAASYSGYGSQALAADSCEVTFASLCCKLGTALHTMHRFESTQAVRLLQELPGRHYRTGYVLGLAALCHFEGGDYEKAEQLFKEVRRIEPRRVEGLEYFSSTLWHLGRSLELGNLARQCLECDRSKPQVWCVVGNCFSLQREHETAVKFLKRAMQVDESFTYAYTLCGHELVADDKFDKAMQMYEQALAIDPRHYNAWWGLGNIYNRQESHENARYHFLKALEINKSNSVLRHYLGMALGSLGENSASLDSIELDEDEATPSPRGRRAGGGAGHAHAAAAGGAAGGRQRTRAAPVPAAPANAARAGRAF